MSGFGRRARPARRLAVAAGLGATLAFLGVALAGCDAPAGADAATRLDRGVEHADLGWAAVRAEVTTDGLSRSIALGLVTDDDAVDSSAIRSTLQVALDTVGDDGLSRISLTVRHGDDRGELLPVWPACADLGFTEGASESDVHFNQPVATVRKVLGR